MDDILLTGNDASEIPSIITFLNSEFKIKNLENIHYFLGMEILREKQGFLLHKENLPWIYCSSSINLDLQFLLLWIFSAISHTQPDLSFAVLILSQFMQSPSLYHYNAAL